MRKDKDILYSGMQLKMNCAKRRPLLVQSNVRVALDPGEQQAVDSYYNEITSRGECMDLSRSIGLLSPSNISLLKQTVDPLNKKAISS